MQVHKSAFIIAFSCALGIGNVATGDSILEDAIREHFVSGSLKIALEYRIEQSARNFSKLECEHFVENTGLYLDFISQGLSLDYIKADSIRAGEPTFIEDFISRQSFPHRSGTSASARAKIVLAVEDSCQTVADELIAKTIQ